MDTHPVTENCRRSLESRIHVCFGISPFNSYFSEQRLEEIARWGRREFAAMHFFVPDIPSAYTLEALGYDSEKAEWKARRQCQYLQNKIHRALRNVGFSDAEACDVYLGWEKLSSNSRYGELHDQAETQFRKDPVFRGACLNASRWVLEKRVPDVSLLSPESLLSAARYLLAELPLFVDAAGIAGKEASVFAYHQRVDFIEELYRDEIGFPVSSRQGFVILECQTAKPATEITVLTPYEPQQAPNLLL